MRALSASDLPVLYRKLSKLLRLAPDDHTEQVFKQILGSCQSVVESLGVLRNKLSDLLIQDGYALTIAGKISGGPRYPGAPPRHTEPSALLRQPARLRQDEMDEAVQLKKQEGDMVHLCDRFLVRLAVPDL